MTAGVESVGLGSTKVSRQRAMSPIIVLSFVIASLVLVAAVLGDVLAPQDPDAQDVLASFAGPSGAHWLGTDALGRDVFSRVISGSRNAVVGPMVIAFGSMVLGNLLGLLAGYRGGKIDATIMRWVDFMSALPGLLVLVVVAAVFGGGYWAAVAILVLLSVPFDTRVVRAATLEQVSLPYVEAARTLGVRDRKIMLFHVWPNVASVTVANTFLVFAGSLVALAALAFLGFGAPPGTPDWGRMVAEGQALLFANPVAVLAPALAIVLTATAMNLIGDWTYERMSSRGATR